MLDSIWSQWYSAGMLSSRNIRFALAFALIMTVVGMVAAIFFKSSRPAPPQQVNQNLPSNIDLALNKAVFTEMKDGLVVWELVAERADYDKSGETAHLTKIRMKFEKTKTSRGITVVADKGDYSVKSKNIKLRGNVHAVTDDEATFDSESLDYIASSSTFVTDAPVKFKQQRLSLMATGMVMDVHKQKAFFKSSIKSILVGQVSK